ncbi:hypothetical protein FHS21_005658 [Phyllobacterium trifolii]|uniref:Serine/threonine protein phosphatase n=1 Tax=Phyllobacterium trifolii TaxID=300193 RepID=A0A839UDV4_9HYPH|nr:hypothetical protein [Phyllobacterium trifolii]
MRGISQGFLDFDGEFSHIIVHGHTPTQTRMPVVRHNRINVDTGAYFSGRLTCLVVPHHEENPEFLYVRQLGAEYRISWQDVRFSHQQKDVERSIIDRGPLVWNPFTEDLTEQLLQRFDVQALTSRNRYLDFEISDRTSGWSTRVANSYEVLTAIEEHLERERRHAAPPPS